MEMIYKNKSRNRLKNNHKYLCDISPPSHGNYTYLVHFYKPYNHFLNSKQSPLYNITLFILFPIFQIQNYFLN